ncbi:ankyrin repeat domain-containing protein [Candidatus Jidaibacter acanthamoebae]|uniref:ankyrin repeat domain-containing protein n=1 Tax=Candidatus Jidaibacter acanthamoebae TaxID=86105 RepID=UPI00126A3063|nr:ankyrin repeat domain-containing protein [Candidatus Jidaibacter acanthamoeba]
MIHQANVIFENRRYEIVVLSCESERKSDSEDYLTKAKFFEIWKAFLLGSTVIAGIDKVSYIEKLNHMSINRVFNVIMQKANAKDKPDLKEEKIDEDIDELIFTFESDLPDEKAKQEANVNKLQLAFESNQVEDSIVEKKDLLQIAIETNQTNIVNILFDKFQINYSDTHMKSALSRRRVYGKDMSILLFKKTEPDLYSEKIALNELFRYAKKNDWDKFLSFLKKQPKEIEKYINKKLKGHCLLHLATAHAPLEVVKALVEMGADCSITNDKEQNSLHIAALLADDKETFYYLLDKFPLMLESKDNFGNTPVMIMGSKDSPEVEKIVSGFTESSISSKVKKDTLDKPPSCEKIFSFGSPKIWELYEKLMQKAYSTENSIVNFRS